MRERSYAPTVLVGLGAAALTAVAGTKDWARASGDAAGAPVRAAATGSQTAPLVVALALVALAAWGVVLVLRGTTRRVVAVLGALACAGILLAAGAAPGAARHDALVALAGKGATGAASSAGLTAWYVVALAGAAVCLTAFAVAVVRVPDWPAMGSRYDAPAARAAAPATDQDLWRALDEGHDPTT